MRYIDVHCHLDGGEYGSLERLIENCRRLGIEKLIASGYDLNSSRFCKELSKQFDGVYFTAGFHPCDAKKCGEGDLQRIAELGTDKKCVGIGEIGLDYHYDDTDKELQHKFFLSQLELAASLRLPVVIHSRDAAEDTLNILKEHKNLLACGFVMHCYAYSPEIAEEMQKLGGYFSFGGTSTYSGSKRARRTIAAISGDRLLTETDSPYLAPASKKGQFPNTPESIPEIAENMAAVRGTAAEETTEKIWENAHRIFYKLNWCAT